MIVLLGPQSLRPTLPEVLAGHGVKGPVATVTAGWQEREDDDDDLMAALEGRGVNLRLYARTEAIFAADPALKQAYRARQERLRVMQDSYRIRLGCALEAIEILGRRKVPPDEIEVAVGAVRAIDAEHLARCQVVHAEFEAHYHEGEREAVAKQRAEVDAILARVEALAIAGGHVAVLLNRMKLFALRHERVFAWSAGAMAITQRVVLFHDSPPQGEGHAEVLDAGLGLCRGVVALPSPRLRLRLDDRPRVAAMARRFAPAACLALDDGAWVALDGARHAVRELRIDGSVA